MDNIGLCVVIRYFGLKGLSFKEVYEDMVAKIREGAPSYSEELGCVIQTWQSLKDDPGLDGLVTVITQKTIDKILDMILTVYFLLRAQVVGPCGDNYQTLQVQIMPPLLSLSRYDNSFSLIQKNSKLGGRISNPAQNQRWRADPILSDHDGHCCHHYNLPRNGVDCPMSGCHSSSDYRPLDSAGS